MWELIKERINHWVIRVWTKGFGTVDGVLTVMVFWGLIRGHRNGMAKELGRVLELYAAALFSIHFGLALSDWLSAKIQLPLYFVHGCVFFALCFAAVVFMRGFLTLTARVGTLSFSPFMEKMGGMIVGAVRFTMITALASYMLFLFHSPHLNEVLIKRSKTGRFSVAVPRILYQNTMRFFDRLNLAAQVV